MAKIMSTLLLDIIETVLINSMTNVHNGVYIMKPVKKMSLTDIC